MKHLRASLVITAILLVLCCGVYPAVVTAGAQVLFPRQANGSVIEGGGKVRGSSLIGQTFEKPANTPPPRKEKPDKYSDLHPREKRARQAQEGK